MQQLGGAGLISPPLEPLFDSLTFFFGRDAQTCDRFSFYELDD